MRIAKLTIDGYAGYGNVLQNYALQQALLQYSTTVDTIWHEKDNFLPRVWGKWTWKEYVKYILNFKDFRNKISNGHIGKEMVRQGKIKDWCDRFIHYRTDVKNLKDIVEEYDFFVVGSDQVWNPYSYYLNDNFLRFVPKRKRISYAASIAMPYIPDDKKKIFKKGIEEMAYVSVREQEAANILEKMTDKKIFVVIDPTLLLSCNEWNKLGRRPSWYHGQDYILSYFLGKEPTNTVEKISRSLNLPIVSLMNDMNYDYYVTGVDEFIWAIEHAKFIYTDSFHGTVFSIIFKRPFLVSNRVDQGIYNNMNSRIDSLLSLFDLENRKVDCNFQWENNKLLTINFHNADTILLKEKAKANKFLRESLNIK